MDYRFYLYKANFFIVISLLAFDCFLYSAQNDILPLRRQRSEESFSEGSISEGSTAFSEGSLSPLGSEYRDNSPGPVNAKNFDDVYSMIGNKSFVSSKNYHVRELYDQLLQEQSERILSDFCQIAGITVGDLSADVRDLKNNFPGSQTDPKDITCPIKKFFSDHGYGHTLITLKQDHRWDSVASFTSCKGVTILPIFFTLSSSSQQAILHKELQHLIHSDSFYKHTMSQIVLNPRRYRSSKTQIDLQNILEQYEQFLVRRADLKAGISGGDVIVDSLAHESYHALNAPVSYMQELSSMIEQEKKAPVVQAWLDECAKSRSIRHVILKSTVCTQEFSDSDDDQWTDAQEFNNRLQCTGVDF
ncbi:MAG: hypothetical protein WC747_02835 [Candidatus Babeliales bacterium]|jgi:hypothetical protein